MNDTNIILYKDIEFTNQNTIKFADKNSQSAYFNSKIFGRINQYEKIIVDSIAVSDYDYYQLQEITYISTQRVIAGKTKTYYYRVIEIEYSNDGLTILNVILDTIQTYMFDYEIKDSIIVREHQDRWDKNGNRIISQTEEPINPSKYVYIPGRITDSDAQIATNSSLRNIHYALITEALTSEEDPTRYGAVYSNTKTYIVPFFLQTGMDWQEVYIRIGDGIDYKAVSYEVLSSIVKDNKIADISILGDIPDVDLYIDTNNKMVMDFSFLDAADYGSKISIVSKIGNTSFPEVVGKKLYTNDKSRNGTAAILVSDAWHYENKLSARFNLDHGKVVDYIFNTTGNKVEKESKLFSSQYSKVSVLSGLSNSIDLYIDEMSIGAKNFDFSYRIGNGVSKMTILTPSNYNVPRQTLVGGVETTLPLVSDDYINYLRNENNSRRTAMIGGIVQGIAGLGVAAATGGLGAGMAVGTAMNGVMSFANEAAKRVDLKNKPTETSKEADNIDFNLSMNLIKYRLELKLPSDEDKVKIKDFFFRYGYSALTSGKPNLTSRKNFNYVELNNMVIKGPIPAIDKEELKQIYGAGIRFWHNPTTFLNFEIDNDEVI